MSYPIIRSPIGQNGHYLPYNNQQFAATGGTTSAGGSAGYHIDNGIRYSATDGGYSVGGNGVFNGGGGGGGYYGGGGK